MDNFWTELGTALTPILTSLISVLVAFLIRFINIKVAELKGKVDDKTEYKYIEMILEGDRDQHGKNEKAIRRRKICNDDHRAGGKADMQVCGADNHKHARHHLL